MRFTGQPCKYRENTDRHSLADLFAFQLGKYGQYTDTITVTAQEASKQGVEIQCMDY